jgi:hypothetical protein
MLRLLTVIVSVPNAVPETVKLWFCITASGDIWYLSGATGVGDLSSAFGAKIYLLNKCTKLQIASHREGHPRGM